MPPVLSVIIPIYNAEEYLEQTLSSVLNQDLKDLEVICIDDGSTDRSLEIIDSFSRNDNRVKYLHQNNQHAGAARNKGLSIAQGEYIHFLDADDYVLKNEYRSVVSKARRKNLDCIKFCAINYNCSTNEFIITDPEKYYKISPAVFNIVTSLSKKPELLQLRVTPWTGIYKRSFLEKKQIRFNTLTCVNDRSFFHQVLFHSDRIMIIKNQVLVHRSNVRNSLIQKRAMYFDCHYESIRIIENFLLQNNADQDTLKSILSLELDDLLVWFKRLQNDTEYSERIKNITIKTIQEFSLKYPDLSIYQSVFESSVNK